MEYKKNIGKRVNTFKFGKGIIKSIDSPESDKEQRYLIELDDPKRFFNSTPCFFPEEEGKEFEFIDN